MPTTSRELTVGSIVTVGLAGIGWTASADQLQASTVIPRDQNAAEVAVNVSPGERRTGHAHCRAALLRRRSRCR